MTLSSVPPPPPSSVTLTLDGWIHLPRPAALTPADFERALQDLQALHKLEWREVRNHVYVRWIS